MNKKVILIILISLIFFGCIQTKEVINDYDINDSNWIIMGVYLDINDRSNETILNAFIEAGNNISFPLTITLDVNDICSKDNCTLFIEDINHFPKDDVCLNKNYCFIKYSRELEGAKK